MRTQHLAAATPAGTSLVAIQRHVAVTLATWDAVWEEYLHPKCAEQKMRLHGAQGKVLERYFKKLEEEAAVEFQKRWGTRKQLVVFFGYADIGTRGGWGAKAVLQACRKVAERANSRKPTDRVPGKVVTVDEFRTSRVSSAISSPQPCEAELDRSKPTRLEGWKPHLLRSLVAVSLKPAVRGASAGAHVVPTAAPGYPWGPWQMGGQGLQRSPQPPAGRGEQVAPTGAVQVATPSKASCQGQGIPSIGLQEAARPSTQGPSPAALVISAVAAAPAHAAP
ncbi:hypothetical protein HaLaN_25975, partial [Haematococcus lacustris]